MQKLCVTYALAVFRSSPCRADLAPYLAVGNRGSMILYRYWVRCVCVQFLEYN
ncbi:hypothetical protein HMPREF1869_01150 [Bacteroidales bacterium KA00251]|nr:hypothetical protein HMPREF1869_01150 [Bacteroidales bacterium KA00251]